MMKKKICMVGAFAVGKTSLVQRHVYSIFSQEYHTTVGVKIDKKTVTANGQQLDLIIWDLHGEDEFQSVRTSYLRGSSGFIFVVDGTRRNTLDVAMDLRSRAESVVGGKPCVMALNKCDLRNQWEITSDDIKQLAVDQISMIETSAKTGHSVELLFSNLVELMMEAE